MPSYRRSNKRGGGPPPSFCRCFFDGTGKKPVSSPLKRRVAARTAGRRFLSRLNEEGSLTSVGGRFPRGGGGERREGTGVWSEHNIARVKHRAGVFVPFNVRGRKTVGLPKFVSRSVGAVPSRSKGVFRTGERECVFPRVPARNYVVFIFALRSAIAAE